MKWSTMNSGFYIYTPMKEYIFFVMFLHDKCVIYCRVVQKNLVFVVGLSNRLADTEVLKRQEYFGKYGKILKVVINSSTSYAGAQVSLLLEMTNKQRQKLIIVGW